MRILLPGGKSDEVQAVRRGLLCIVQGGMDHTSRCPYSELPGFMVSVRTEWRFTPAAMRRDTRRQARGAQVVSVSRAKQTGSLPIRRSTDCAYSAEAHTGSVALLEPKN